MVVSISSIFKTPTSLTFISLLSAIPFPGSLFAQSEVTHDTATIIQKSPFLPPNYSPPTNNPPPQATRPQNNASYQFKGIYQLGGEYRLLISEKRNPNGKWVTVGQTLDDFSVRRYDPKSQAVTIFYNNREEVIQLANLNPNPTPMPVAGQPSAIPGSQPNSSSPAGPVRRRITPPGSPPENGPTSTRRTPPETPPWLQKLREQSAAANGGLTPSGVNLPNASEIPPPPTDLVPPPPPPDIDISTLPPVPKDPPPIPPELKEMMKQNGVNFGPEG